VLWLAAVNGARFDSVLKAFCPGQAVAGVPPLPGARNQPRLLDAADRLGAGCSRSLERGLQQIPEIAVEIAEDSHRAIGFCLWLANELNPSL
jgi:hypothetical protein